MPIQDAARAGTISWVDLQTPDRMGARRFYSALLGWMFTGGEDPNTGFYSTAFKDGRSVAGIAQTGPQWNRGSMWSVYFATDNVDVTVQKATDAGAKIMHPPIDIGPQGRMAYVIEPGGSMVGLWQGRQHRGAQLVGETGAMCWHEVYSRDVKATRNFLSRTFGLEAKSLGVPGLDYETMHLGPLTVCGTMAMPDHFPKDMPSHWNTYFAVDDVDGAVDKVSALGGKVISPAFDTPMGRLAFVADPFGARFNVMKPAR